MSRTLEEAKNDYERKIVDMVAEHGWFCVRVFDPDGKLPGFAYSVGFTQTLNCPEFIVFGLSTELMNSMLWGVFEQIRDGKIPQEGQRWSDLIRGYDCISRAVHPTYIIRDYFNSALWFGGKQDNQGSLKAFQLVWPGNGSGLFPWEDKCPQEVREAQTQLYLPNPDLS